MDIEPAMDMKKHGNALNWNLKKFQDLTLDELYALLKLRTDVFSVEQQAVYQDLDGKDRSSLHLMGTDADRLVAYCRILPPGLAFTEPSIGRVVTALSHRGTGTGKTLFQKGLEICLAEYGERPIRIGAQYYLVGFYGSFGFQPAGDIYLEDGIEHVHMLRPGGRNGQQ